MKKVKGLYGWCKNNRELTKDTLGRLTVKGIEIVSTFPAITIMFNKKKFILSDNGGEINVTLLTEHGDDHFVFSLPYSFVNYSAITTDVMAYWIYDLLRGIGINFDMRTSDGLLITPTRQ